MATTCLLIVAACMLAGLISATEETPAKENKVDELSDFHDPELYDASDIYGPDDFTEVDKRKGVRPVPYPCNGYDHLPRCLHGGRGPRKTMTKAGQFCVCLCPVKWIGPECGYAADNMGKRTYPWKILGAGRDEKRSEYEDEEMEKRSYPWLVQEAGKRTYPWEVMAKGKRAAYPWEIMAKGKRTYPWEVMAKGKRRYPWKLMGNDEFKTE